MKFILGVMVFWAMVLWLLVMLTGCGIKTKISCQVDDKAETLKEIGDKCWEQPEFGIKKEF
jgi:hypothetical protein